MVENLAYTPSISPLPPMKPILRRRRWKKGDNAFLVIKRDQNNNDKQVKERKVHVAFEKTSFKQAC